MEVMKQHQTLQKINEVEIPAGTTDSMFTSSDFISDSEKQEILHLMRVTNH